MDTTATTPPIETGTRSWIEDGSVLCWEGHVAIHFVLIQFELPATSTWKVPVTELATVLAPDKKCGRAELARYFPDITIGKYGQKPDLTKVPHELTFKAGVAPMMYRPRTGDDTGAPTQPVNKPDESNVIWHEVVFDPHTILSAAQNTDTVSRNGHGDTDTTEQRKGFLARVFSLLPRRTATAVTATEITPPGTERKTDIAPTSNGTTIDIGTAPVVTDTPTIKPDAAATGDTAPTDTTTNNKKVNDMNGTDQNGQQGGQPGTPTQLPTPPPPQPSPHEAWLKQMDTSLAEIGKELNNKPRWKELTEMSLCLRDMVGQLKDKKDDGSIELAGRATRMNEQVSMALLTIWNDRPRLIRMLNELDGRLEVLKEGRPNDYTEFKKELNAIKDMLAKERLAQLFVSDLNECLKRTEGLLKKVVECREKQLEEERATVATKSAELERKLAEAQAAAAQAIADKEAEMKRVQALAEQKAESDRKVAAAQTAAQAAEAREREAQAKVAATQGQQGKESHDPLRFLKTAITLLTIVAVALVCLIGLWLVHMKKWQQSEQSMPALPMNSVHSTDTTNAPTVAAMVNSRSNMMMTDAMVTKMAALLMSAPSPVVSNIGIDKIVYGGVKVGDSNVVGTINVNNGGWQPIVIIATNGLHITNTHSNAPAATPVVTNAPSTSMTNACSARPDCVPSTAIRGADGSYAWDQELNPGEMFECRGSDELVLSLTWRGAQTWYFSAKERLPDGSWKSLDPDAVTDSPSSTYRLALTEKATMPTKVRAIWRPRSQSSPYQTAYQHIVMN